MAQTFDEKIPFSKDGLEFAGLFKRGQADKPLVVLLHGGGTSAAYFDNSCHSVAKGFSDLGYNVLNINRPSYGGTPTPATTTPLADSLLGLIDLIDLVYREKTGGQQGIVLIGHSLGGALSLVIAAEAGARLPVLGVSTLGTLPSTERLNLIPEPDPDPANPRFVFSQSAENLTRFLGNLESVNVDALSGELAAAVFEPGLKSEIREYESRNYYDYLLNKVFPSIKVPVQFLAAETELIWSNITEAQPKFDNLVKRFTSAPEVEAKLLPGGGHNYEFSINASKLFDLRRQFVERVANRGRPSDAFTSIPILDYSQATNPSTRPAFLAALRDAIVRVGFFYLKNASIPPDVQDALVEQSIALFNLPLEKKLEIEMVNSKHFLGYARLGAEVTALKSDYREQFDFATELPPPGPDEPVYRNLRGPNQWPDPEALPGFRPAVEAYLSAVDALAESFKSLVAEALDLPPTAFDQFFEYPQQHKLKLIKYPEPQSDDQTQGVGPHKDSCFLTFLLQGTPHTGLEVQNKAGVWLPVTPIPGTLVINIGRALEALTGGVCTATTHRVSLKKENYVDANGNSLGPRYSFAVFQGVSLDLSAEKLKLDIPPHIRDLVKDDKVRSDAEATFNKMFQGNIGEGTFIARITSHQDVAQRWYPDLLAEALRKQQEFKSKNN
ncbi:hypothetical protein VTN96DRAFT_5402 [Rasamsonia emersonii]|uniref:Oxidoreductase, 2OG-Fe(II) oxygenase family n=1 Tax=Rasamsonia emersonii (strain ATCC 16479 / CBS 393.64 / IMI 116815) TaxID=1408163 RepID=A0A0F4Z4N4_RASE3|nr:Oxidoreductase, 2OG-Fe(II) oxygenase family [Rasamsonia emersonii CBS 393.64]KKA25494.1 Oxidoreductase, 2OG-Fe(II) oxygenase family [Rasamsonia emersonii CBS 393.64]